MSTTRILSQQDRLIARIRNFGYSFSDDALCYGFAATGLQALLVGEIQRFDQRLLMIKRIPASKFFIENTTKIKIKSQNANKQSIISTKDFSVEFAAFFESVIMHYDASFLNEPFKLALSPGVQSIETSFQYIASEKLENLGGLKRLNNAIFRFNPGLLDNFLANLKKLYSALERSSDLALFILSTNHAISVGYDNNKNTWFVVDANKWKNGVFSSESTYDTAVYIIERMSNNKNAIIEITYYTNNQQYNSVIDKFTSWYNRYSQVNLDQDDVNIADSDGGTLLHLASEANDVQLTTQLLDLGANPTVTTTEGFTPLIAATMANNLQITTRLLQAAPKNINQRHIETGNTALEHAIENNNPDITNALLLHGADLKLKNHDNKSPMDLASGNPRIHNLLKFHTKIPCRPLDKNKNLFFKRRAEEGENNENERHNKKPRLDNDYQFKAS